MSIYISPFCRATDIKQSTMWEATQGFIYYYYYYYAYSLSLYIIVIYFLPTNETNCWFISLQVSALFIPTNHTFRMQNFDDMHVHFRDGIQKKWYEALSKRPMLPTRYPDSDYFEALGIEPNIKSMCIHLDWDEYSERKNVTYRNLTLEFLSLLTY